MARFKANEMRNLLFYGSIIFKNFLSKENFEHLILYVVFIRVLCQDSVNLEEIKQSYDLIELFNRRFEHLYGKEYLMYNLHAHLHLPKQVMNYGPINKISAFPFEGFFKVIKNLIHGTREITNGITNNLEIQSYLFFRSDEHIEIMKSRHLKDFLQFNIYNKNFVTQDTCLIRPKYFNDRKNNDFNNIKNLIEIKFEDVLKELRVSDSIYHLSQSILLFFISYIFYFKL